MLLRRGKGAGIRAQTQRAQILSSFECNELRPPKRPCHSPLKRKASDDIEGHSALFLPSLQVQLSWCSPDNAENIAFTSAKVEDNEQTRCVRHLRRRKPSQRRRCPGCKRRQHSHRRLDPPASFQRAKREEAERKATRPLFRPADKR